VFGYGKMGYELPLFLKRSPFLQKKRRRISHYRSPITKKTGSGPWVEEGGKVLPLSLRRKKPASHPSSSHEREGGVSEPGPDKSDKKREGSPGEGKERERLHACICGKRHLSPYRKGGYYDDHREEPWKTEQAAFCRKEKKRLCKCFKYAGGIKALMFGEGKEGR